MMVKGEIFAPFFGEQFGGFDEEGGGRRERNRLGAVS